jgi:hypothetical protein
MIATFLAVCIGAAILRRRGQIRRGLRCKHDVKGTLAFSEIRPHANCDGGSAALALRREMADVSTSLENKTQSELAGAALRFARRAHLGQHRKQTHEQFVEHPIAVARLLAEAGFDDEVIVAAYLHDIVEKTEIGLPEIRERFGPEVAAIIDSLSEDDAITDYAERKRALRRRVLDSDRSAIVIYAADRVANMRDWRRVSPEGRDQIGTRLETTVEERLELWREDLEEMTRLDPEPPFLAEIEIELQALSADPQLAA